MEVSLPTAIKLKSTFLPAVMTQAKFIFLSLWKGRTFCVICHLCGLYSPPYIEHKSGNLAEGPFSKG